MKVFVDEVPYLGKGPIDLLAAIDREGSISKAAKATRLSYRKAWQLVENMNRIAKRPLVEKKLGGHKGGGAVVTPWGKEIISQYLALETKMEDYIQRNFNPSGFL